MGYHIYRRLRRRFLLCMWSDGHQRDHHYNRVWNSPVAGPSCDTSTFVVIGDYHHNDHLKPGWRNTEAVDDDLFTSINQTSQ